MGYWVGRSADVTTANFAAVDSAERPSPRAGVASSSSPGGERSGTVRPTPTMTASGSSSRETAASGSTGTLQQLNYLAAAQRDKLATVRVPITTNERDSKLSEAFVKLFALTEPERQTLQNALEHARHDVDQMANSSVAVKEDAGSLVFVMKPFDGGADVYDRLMDVFAQTLGPERNAAFVALQADQLSRSFNGFGAEERTVTLTRDAATNGATYAVHDDRRSSQMRSVGTSNVPNLEALAERYPMVAPYLDKIAQLPPKSKPGAGK